MPADMDVAEVKGMSATAEDEVSALGDAFWDSPMVVPTRGHLDSFRKLMREDLGSATISRCRRLDAREPSAYFGNTYEVTERSTRRCGHTRAGGWYATAN